MTSAPVLATTGSIAPTPAPGRPGVIQRDGQYLPAGDGGTLSGPWQHAFWFAMTGPVLSKANHRRGDRRSGGNAGRQNAGFELAVNAAARTHRPAGWRPGTGSEPVAARPRFVLFCFARTVLDTGNLDKSVLDALQGPIMFNDSQVCWSTSSVVRSAAEPGLVVAVAQLAAGAQLTEQCLAGAVLSSHVVSLLRTTP